MLVSPSRPESKKPIGLLSIYVIILSKMWYNEPIDYVCGVADRKGPLNHRCLLGLWYNEPIDYVCSVAERKGSLNHRYCACYGEKQRMLYSTERSINSTTEFVKMVVESQ